MRSETEKPEVLRGGTESRRWLNPGEMAHHLGVSRRSITNLMLRRILPHVKIGRLIRFDLEACEHALRQFEVKSAGQPRVGRSDWKAQTSPTLQDQQPSRPAHNPPGSPTPPAGRPGRSFRIHSKQNADQPQ